MPKRILRSIIDCDDSPLEANLRVNFQRLKDSPLEWVKPSDKQIYRFIQSYWDLHLECPSLQILVDHFASIDEIETLERLKEVREAEVYLHANFAHLLKGLVEEQNKIKALALIKEAQDIVVKGVTIGKGRQQIRKEGIRDAILHITDQAQNLIAQDGTVKNQGDLRSDTKATWEDYQTAKHEKHRVWGRLSGLEAIDTICHGHRKGELWVHAAFSGELKSTFAMNWAYNLITRYRTNVLYISLEVPYEQIRKIVHTMHTSNLKFITQGRKPLDYRKVRDGELSPEEEDFLKEALEDLENNPEYCALDVIAPDRDWTIDDVRSYAELLHKKKELGFIVIDHGSLLEPRRNRQFRDYTIALNSVLRDAKKLALQFNHGEGIPVLFLFQINRQGKNEADKAEGRYKMSALSYSNEAERSADVITTTYLNDEHRDLGTTLFCNLKNRDNPLFKPFQAAVDFTCRRIYNLDSWQGTAGSGITVEDHDAVVQALSGV